MKSFFIITLVTLCLYISVDFIFGFHILNLFKSKDLRVQSHEFGYHNFSHSFDGYEGNIRYCTNKYGFRISCSKKNKEYSKNFEIFFIGDSFTEGYQVDYDYTFVGIIENNTKKKIANLAVSSYSPTIYYEKIKYFIKKGFKFEHLVVYIDISDISDEAVHYSDSLTLKRKIKNSIRNLFPFSYFVLKKLTIKKKNQLKTSNNKNRKDIYPLIETSKKNTEKKNLFKDKYFWRSAWTYNKNLENYGNLGVKGGIEKSLHLMNKLYSLCEKNNIKLSIAVYPWPAQILYDDVNSIQVGIWKKYCKNKCYRFINNFETFFSILGDKDPDSFIDEFYNDGDVHFNEKGHKIIAKKFIEVF